MTSFLLAFCCSFIVADIEVEIEKAFREGMKLQIELAEKQVKEYMNELKAIPRSPGTRKDKEAKEKRLTNEIVALKQTIINPPVKMLASDNIGVSEVGVFQSAVEVDQVLGDGDFLGTVGKTSYRFHGWNYGNLRDDMKIRISERVTGSGTSTYRTVIGGTKTVVVIEKAPEAIVDKIRMELESELPYTKDREWKLIKDGEAFTGKLMSYNVDEKQVAIMVKGESRDVKLTQLSPDDRKYIAKTLGVEP
jgi:hypothetical protein